MQKSCNYIIFVFYSELPRTGYVGTSKLLLQNTKKWTHHHFCSNLKCYQQHKHANSTFELSHWCRLQHQEFRLSQLYLRPYPGKNIKITQFYSHYFCEKPPGGKGLFKPG